MHRPAKVMAAARIVAAASVGPLLAFVGARACTTLLAYVGEGAPSRAGPGALWHIIEHTSLVAAVATAKACSPPLWPPPPLPTCRRRHRRRPRLECRRCAAACPGQLCRPGQQRGAGRRAHPPPAGPLQLQDGQGAAGGLCRLADALSCLAVACLDACVPKQHAWHAEVCCVAAASHVFLADGWGTSLLLLGPADTGAPQGSVRQPDGARLPSPSLGAPCRWRCCRTSCAAAACPSGAARTSWHQVGVRGCAAVRGMVASLCCAGSLSKPRRHATLPRPPLPPSLLQGCTPR